MEFGKRSAPQPAPRQAEETRPTPANTTPRVSHSAPAQGSGKKKLWWVIVLVVLLALAVGGLFVWSKSSNSALAGLDKNKYQAIFLSNGQVYFGKLSDSSPFQVKISKIYYLQVQQDVQGGDKSKEQDNNQVSLAKLGDELHGPQDEMFIAKDQVLFWENLKDDSKVVQAIKSAGN
jgi:uncharacterized protein HemX